MRPQVRRHLQDQAGDSSDGSSGRVVVAILVSSSGNSCVVVVGVGVILIMAVVAAITRTAMAELVLVAAVIAV